jgi:hypothetical protein
LQPVISLILFPVLDNASEEIFFSRVNENGTAQFNRLKAVLLSVRNDQLIPTLLASRQKPTQTALP